MEIYNEKISDLLQFDTKEREKSLKIQDGTDGNVNIEGLTERDIKTAEDVIKAMEEGQALRHTAGTSMNERSSRSHTIFRIQIVSCDKQSREAGFEDGRAIKVSFLNLVDLAGSERASQTGATGIRLREGKFFSSNLNGKELSSTEPPYFHEVFARISSISRFSQFEVLSRFFRPNFFDFTFIAVVEYFHDFFVRIFLIYRFSGFSLFSSIFMIFSPGFFRFHVSVFRSFRVFSRFSICLFYFRWKHQ